MQVMMGLKIIVSIVKKDIQPQVKETHLQTTVQVRICKLCYYWYFKCNILDCESKFNIKSSFNMLISIESFKQNVLETM